ncbi:hypothetical protein LUW77_29025 [Streptomyces radiopugnans]|nr:hypothetical protein LUW77_29025 [Streptomyces radiopugnans]
MAGVEFGPEDAAVIADLLVRTGVSLVEVGMVSGPNSKDADLVLATHEAVTPERSMTLVVVRDRLSRSPRPLTRPSGSVCATSCTPYPRPSSTPR